MKRATTPVAGAPAIEFEGVHKSYCDFRAVNARTRLSSAGLGNGARTRTTPGFLDAPEAQVHLQQGEWAAAETAARRVVDSGDHALAASYADLFQPSGSATSEDIFRVAFTATDANVFGCYYQFEGRFETGATQEIFDL